MSNYKVGDKVVIHKDLVEGELYGGCYWDHTDELLKDYEYVIIEEVDDDGEYWIEGCDTFVSDEMIAGLYDDLKNNTK